MTCGKCKQKCKSFNIKTQSYLIDRLRIFSNKTKKCKIIWKCGEQTWEPVTKILKDCPYIIWDFKYNTGKWIPYDYYTNNTNLNIVSFIQKQNNKVLYKFKSKIWCKNNISHLLNNNKC